MKKIIITIAILIATLSITAQTWVDLLMEGGKYEETKELFEIDWQQKTPEKGKGFKQFKRWEEFAGSRLGEDGFVNTPALWEAYSQQQIAKNKNSKAPHHWRLVGPSQTPINGGNGRLNCVAFHPSNPDIIYVGAPAGGIWKTTDGGLSWTSNTDFLDCIGISDIVINPLNPRTMYMATGDKDGGDTYSLGVMKSYDAGETWFPTTLAFETPAARKVSRLLIHPHDTSIVFAATSFGIYKSVNGGDIWERKRLGNFKDMAFKPHNPNIIYAATSSAFQRSINGGENFSALPLPTLGFSPSRIAIGVTPSDSNYIYLLLGNNENQGFGALLMSSNGGDSISLKANSPNLLGWSTSGSDEGGQAWYDLAIAVHPTQKNIVYTGGVNIWRSTNAGTSWNLNAHWYGGGGKPYVHADIHELKYAPNSTKLYACTDGGLFMTQNNGQTWTDLSSNLVIGQIYRMDHSSQNSNIVLSGWQDNGTNLGVNNEWSMVLGGDGMDCAVDYTNDNIMYGSYYYGAFFRSDDGGYVWESIYEDIPEQGAWITPIAIDPIQASKIYLGYKNVFKSTDYGYSWTQVSNFQTSSNIKILKIAPSNTDFIYIGYDLNFARTTDGGITWENLNSSYGTTITDIAIHPNNENEAWITCSGYSSQNKVLYTIDGGASWTNISENLPNIPVNCIIYEKNSHNGIYIGTDLGVYYRDTIINTWTHFSGGMPNTVVSDLAIHYNSGKLRAATYGRAIWETDLYYLVNIKSEELLSKSQLHIFPNPAQTLVHISLNNSKIDEGLAIIIDANGKIVKKENISFNYQKCTLDISNLKEGFYILQLQTKYGSLNQKLIIQK